MKKGIGVFVVHENKLMLILRDDKPDISNPCRYALVGGAADSSDEKPIDAALREFEEELSFRVMDKQMKYIGNEEVIAIQKYNDFFGVILTKEQYESIKLNEGQRYGFYTFTEIEALHLIGDRPYGLGGAISRIMEQRPYIVEEILLRVLEEEFNFQT